MRRTRTHGISSWRPRGDQPRMCGEHPKMRPTLTSPREQPRACGEHKKRAVVGLGKGSAPHMRGIHNGRRRTRYVLGVSPAHAGNASRMWRPRRLRRDQPRLRGEYEGHEFDGLRDWGSAPLARGIPTHASGPGVSRRVSPACAGNTPGAWPSTRPNAGQPRTCGEYVDADTDQRRRTGSAPLARGIRTAAPAVRQPDRISPAHAGNTRSMGMRRPDISGQPRTCGEYTARIGGIPRWGGT